MPAYQQRNWQLAYETVCAAIGTVPPEAVTKSKAVYIPGRMEILEVAGKTIIMDGAHNAQKIHAFVASFKKQYPNKKATVVLAMKEGKEYKEVIDCLLPLTNALYVTSFSTSQDLPAHALRPDTIAAYAQQCAVKNIFIEQDAERAFHAALQSSEDVVVVTGSFYLLAQLRQLVHLQHEY
jgi:dihydrofolate synthase/folylpolyglutamate synthase